MIRGLARLGGAAVARARVVVIALYRTRALILVLVIYRTITYRTIPYCIRLRKKDGVKS